MVVESSWIPPKNGPCQRLPHFILQAFCHCQKGTLAVTVDGDYDEWVRLTMTNILGNLVRVKKHGYNPPRNVNWLSILEPAAEIIASHFRYLRLMWLDLFRSFHNSHHHFAKTYIKSVIYFPGKWRQRTVLWKQYHPGPNFEAWSQAGEGYQLHQSHTGDTVNFLGKTKPVKKHS